MKGSRKKPTRAQSGRSLLARRQQSLVVVIVHFLWLSRCGRVLARVAQARGGVGGGQLLEFLRTLFIFIIGQIDYDVLGLLGFRFLGRHGNAAG